MKRSAPVALVVVTIITTAAVSLAGCVTVNVPKTESPAPAEKTSPAPATSSGLAVGDKVAAVWTDGNLYLATVEAIEGDQVTVKYADDGSTKSVAASYVTPVTEKTWEAGDKVLAVWASGRFYKGSVVAGSGTTYTIQWDDGSAPSEVAADKIIAQ